MSSKKSILFNPAGVSEAQLFRSLRKARDIAFPLACFPAPFVDWLTALAFSVNTRPEFVLIGAISVVSTLMGPKTKIKIRERYSEPCNLFTVCLSEPGAGKSQAFELSVETPLKKLHEPARSVVVHDFTRKGLFQHLVAHKGRALLAHSEMSSFYELILKKQQEGSGERQLFCRLYDGTAEWALTSATGSGETGDKREKREVLSESSLALGGFTQPGPFMQLYKPLAKTKDGFLDRILVCSIKPHLLHEEEVEAWGEKLAQYSTQGFAEIYERIYDIHEEGFEYTYSKEAKNLYVEYSNTLSDKMNAQWEGDNACADNLSKDKKNFIRLSCVLHVLLSVVGQFIDRPETVSEEAFPEEDARKEYTVAEEIAVDTLRIAENVIEFFTEQRKAFLMVLNPVTANTNRPEKAPSTSSDSHETPKQVLHSFGQWFTAECNSLPEDDLKTFTMEKPNRRGTQTSWAFRFENCPVPVPFSKVAISVAAEQEGGNRNDTAYFVHDDNKTKKEKCITIPFAAIEDPIKQCIIQILQNRWTPEPQQAGTEKRLKETEKKREDDVEEIEQWDGHSHGRVLQNRWTPELQQAGAENGLEEEEKNQEDDLDEIEQGNGDSRGRVRDPIKRSRQVREVNRLTDGLSGKDKPSSLKRTRMNSRE